MVKTKTHTQRETFINRAGSSKWLFENHKPCREQKVDTIVVLPDDFIAGFVFSLYTSGPRPEAVCNS